MQEIKSDEMSERVNDELGGAGEDFAEAEEAALMARLTVIQESKKLKQVSITELQGMDEALDLSLTEYGNAKKFVDSLGGQVLYIVELKRWAYWGGEKWNINKDSEVERRYKIVGDVLKQQKDELEVIKQKLKDDPITNSDIQEAAMKLVCSMIGRVRKWSSQSLSRKNIENSLAVAATIEGIPVEYREFDKKGQFFGVANGVVDLRDGTLISDEPEYRLLKSSEVVYDESASCPVWDKVMLDIMSGDVEKVELLQQIAGSSLVGNTKDKLFLMNGDGSNGKSTFANIIGRILGAVDEGGYKAIVNPETVSGASSSEQAYALAKLKGVRLIVMNEMGSGDRRTSGNQLDTTIVKRMVDSDEGLQARPIRGEPIEFGCVATMLLNTNHVPSVATTDGGIWRRLCLINFDRVFEDSEKDRDLVKGKLLPELSGILNWAVEGAVKYFLNGQQFDIPESVQRDTDEWRAAEDKLGGFLAESLVVDSETVIKVTELLESYTDWCRVRGYHAGGEKELIKKLKERRMDVSNNYNGNMSHLRGYKFSADGFGLVRKQLRAVRKDSEDGILS